VDAFLEESISLLSKKIRISVGNRHDKIRQAVALGHCPYDRTFLVAFVNAQK
jgi:hypothetical protein